MSNENTKGASPTHIAYHVKEDKQGKAHFNPVGAAWQHRDSKGYDLQLDSVPVSGRVSLREIRDKQMKTYQEDKPTQAPVQEKGHERSR